MSRKQLLCAVAAVACAFTLSLASNAEVSAGSKTARSMITQKIDETKLVTLAGNTRPEALRPGNDHGAVSSSTQMPAMQLLLRRSPEQEAALGKLMDALHTPGNPYYHQWLTAEEFRQSFGVSQSDVNTVKSWLESQGLHVTGATPTGLQIEFTGTVGAVNAAFHTEIHNVADRQGNVHFANISDPRIPAAIATVVVGPTTLNNFPPRNYIAKATSIKLDPKTHAVANVVKPAAGVKPDYTSGSNYDLVAGDIQTIYNITALYTAGYTGKGTTIGFLEDTPIYKTTDFTTYQSEFGLTSYGGTFSENSPAKPASGGVTCTAATDNGDDIEAELDVEMGIAVAPGAKIVDENCADTTVFGGLLAYENLENSTTFPPVISMSYGECEAANGATSNASFSTAFQQGAAEGISTFVSAGDNDTQSCDQAEASTKNDDVYGAWGLGVTGWGETPYNVAVGGTDFGDTYAGTNSTYWSSTNSSTYESALSYVPEIPWNDSCASKLIYTYVGDTSGGTYCNAASSYPNGLRDDIGGGGGYSTCATGSATTTAVVSGTCAGYAQPSWQTGLLGVPSTTPAYGTLAASSKAVRTVPDVSLFAANGVWSHDIIICYTNTSVVAGASCSGAPSAWVGIGGTSASAPMMASIQALVDQYVGSTTNGTGALQGNPNYVYYKLAAAEYGTAGSTACNSTLGNGVASSCVFYDITQGDNDPDCKSGYNCYVASGTYGIASYVNAASDPAYPTTVGYDTATGIGSVNAYNLAANWRNAFPTTTAVTLGSATNSGSSTDQLTATVSAATLDNANSGGTQIAIIGGITFYDGTTSIGTCTITSGAACSYTATGTQFTPGNNSITAVYAGNNAYPGSTSPAKSIVQTDATSTTASANPSTILSTASTSVSATVADTTSASNTPTGTVNFNLGTSGGTLLGSCTLASGTCSATVQGSALALGSNTIVASYQGVTGYAASSGTTSVTVNAPPTNVITFSSVTHNFGTVNVGTAATAYTLAVKNTSTTTAYPFVLNFTAGNGFTSATNCPSTIAAGASCELAFYFTPTATGTVTNSWSLASENGFTYSPSNGGTLTGSGTSQGGLALSTAGHNWGTVTVGTTSAAYGVTLSNSTSSAVTLTLGSVSSPFAAVTNCGATLAAGASCQFQFTFTPTSTATVSQTYSVSAGGVTITSGGNTVTGIVLTGN